MTTDARALVDTGFLAALCDDRDSHHAWARTQAKIYRGPWLTCEACVSEIAHLLSYALPPRSHQIYHMLSEGLVLSQHLLPEQIAPVLAETNRYRSRHVDFADACLVILSDQFPRLPVITTDASDFTVYFRGRTARTLVMPPR